MGDVVVLGAVGTIGRAIVRDLVESGVAVIAADLDAAKLDELKDWVGKTIATATVNIKDREQTIELLKQAKVCVNATNYMFNLDVMEAAAAAGVHVLDLGGLFTLTKEQLKYDERMKAANVLSIVGMGSDPGVSNVFSRYGYDVLDVTEEIHIRFGSTSSGVTFPFAIDTIIDEATKNAFAIKDGVCTEIPPLGDEELTQFHEQIGVQTTYSIIHSELATLPLSFPEVKHITYKDSWDPKTIEKINVLDSLGLLNTDPLGTTENAIVPRRQLVALLQKTLREEPTWGVDELMVEVKGVKNGKKASVKLELLSTWQDEWQISATSYATAVPASIVAQMLLKGEISDAGVKPPEQCVDPGKFLEYLKAKNVELYITYSETEKC